MDNEVIREELRREEERRKTKASFQHGILFGILVSLAIVGIIAFMKAKSEDAKAEAERAQADAASESDVVVDDEMMQKMSAIEQIIDSYYYKDDVEAQELEEGAYRGMLEAVDDRYTCYYSKPELTELMQQTSGVYYGIGAHVTLDETGMYPMILAPIAGSPAEEVDLRPGDVIYQIDGESTYDMSLDSVVALIKGKEGTTVELTIVRSTEPGYLFIEVERRRVESPTIESEMFKNGMAYIRITEFSDVTVQQFADALATAKGSDMKGLILDLRANPGGSLSSVVNIAKMLLPKGLIVYTEDKYGNRDEYSCDGKKEFKLPMVVLVDGNSASASEVLAGAIKDYGTGTLVGTTTYGKGIVQQIINLKDGSAVKITTSSYYSPKGINIHGTGIEPDIVCEFDGEAYYNEDYDNQLEFAKEVLLEMLQ